MSARAFVLAALISIAGSALAQEASLPPGWRSVPAPAVASATSIACTRDRAYVRSWPGDVAVWDGTSSTRLPPVGRNAYGRSIAATDDGHVYLQSGTDIAHFDGAAWSFMPIARASDSRPGELVTALRALDAGHVYFASAGAIGARDGAAFGLFDGGTWRELDAIDATSARDLWTAGQGGTVMRFDGERWSREATGTTVTLTGIRAFGPDDVWAWGGEVLLHRDANGWAPRMDGLVGSYGQMVTAIAGTPTQLYATGAFGIARFDGTRWNVEVPFSAFGPYASSLVGACATTHELVVVVSNGAIVTHAIQ